MQVVTLKEAQHNLEHLLIQVLDDVVREDLQNVASGVPLSYASMEFRCPRGRCDAFHRFERHR